MPTKKTTTAPKGKKKAATKKTTTAAPKAEKGRVLKRKPRTTKETAPTPAEPDTANEAAQAPEAAAPTETIETLAPEATQTIPGSLADLNERFCAHLKGLGKSENTIKSYAADLRVAEKHFGADKLVAEISSDDATSYLLSDRVNLTRGGARRNQITIDKVLRVFRQAIEFAVSQGWMPESPLPAFERKSKKAQTEESAEQEASNAQA